MAIHRLLTCCFECAVRLGHQPGDFYAGLKNLKKNCDARGINLTRFQEMIVLMPTTNQW